MLAIDFAATTTQGGEALAQSTRRLLFGRGILSMPAKANAVSFILLLVISEDELYESLDVIRSVLFELDNPAAEA